MKSAYPQAPVKIADYQKAGRKRGKGRRQLSGNHCVIPLRARKKRDPLLRRKSILVEQAKRWL